jgi:hypothetical protein
MTELINRSREPRTWGIAIVISPSAVCGEDGVDAIAAEHDPDVVPDRLRVDVEQPAGIDHAELVRARRAGWRHAAERSAPGGAESYDPSHGHDDSRPTPVHR